LAARWSDCGQPLMPATVIVGLQWGDECKGKTTDFLAEQTAIVVRYQGGDNAGHTLMLGDEVFKLHLVPSGILYPHIVPVIGPGVVVNPATLIDELDGLLAEIAAGRCTTEERTLLEAHVHRKGARDLDALALNDVVVARGREVRSIHIGVTLDGAPFTTYWSDGLIVATATGSTAYGMSVGGPLIIPSSRAMMIVPIAPHLSFPNAVVLDVDQTIALEVQDEPARLSLDGQEEHDLHVGDRIDVRRAKPVARFVRTATMRPFLTLLRKKILKEEGGPA